MIGVLMIGQLGIAFALLGIDPLKKPGGLLLGGVLCLALTHWVGQVLQSGSRQLLLRSVAMAGLLCVAYSVSFVAVDKLVGANLSSGVAPQLSWIVAGIVLVGFIGMFVLQTLLVHGYENKTLHKWHIHASNGFYVESILRRIFVPLLST